MAKYAALVGSASEGAVTTGARMSGRPVRRARAAVDVSEPRPRLDRHQDIAPGRRLADPRRRPGRGSASTTSSTSVWMNDHLTDVNLARAGAILGGPDGAGGAGPPRARQVGRPRRPVADLPPPVGASPRPPRSWTTRPAAGSSSASAPAGTRPSTSPYGIPFPPMPERFDRFESGVRVIHALGSDAAAADRRGDPARPVLSIGRGNQRSATADPGRPTDLARRPEAARDRAGCGGSPGLAPAGGDARQDADRPGLFRGPPGRAAGGPGGDRP